MAPTAKPRRATPRRRPYGLNMINEITLRNFRGFDETTIKNCRRINVIVGENGSGKTALLEGIFLAAGPSPEIALRTRAWRGMPVSTYSGTQEQLDMALWGDLFHNFNVKRNAVVALSGPLSNRSVNVMFNQREKVIDFGPNHLPSMITEETTPVKFRWKLHGGKKLDVVPRWNDGKLQFATNYADAMPAVFLAANVVPSAIDAAQRFSDLSRAFKSEQFVQHFCEQFKNLSDLSIEVAGGGAMIYAKMAGLPEKIPLTLASGGMNKVAYILLAIATFPAGTILVDEIESGIYYKRLPQVWESIVAMAKEYDCQVFASTHSIECLDAAADVAEKCPEEFSVLRTVTKAGCSTVRQFDGARFIDAMDERIEIR